MQVGIDPRPQLTSFCTIKEDLQMDLGLNGKIALVAASSRGLGKATARALAEEGARIVMCARNQDDLEAAADRLCADTGAEVRTIVCDLTNQQGPATAVQQTVEAMGGLDILVTNIGGPPVGAFADLDDAAWHGGHDAILMSAVRLIREALPSMRKRGGGRIINIASISAKEPIDRLMLSNAYRAALVSMAKTLAGELAADNILINNVCPGRIATDRLVALDQARAEAENVSVEEIRAQAQRQIPLGRYGQADELASLITFLASSRASYITGTTILCDGGLFRGLM